jgi:hypothetical protein
MEQLFQQEAENTNDVRLSVRLYAKCMPDKRRFCSGMPPGGPGQACHQSGGSTAMAVFRA